MYYLNVIEYYTSPSTNYYNSLFKIHGKNVTNNNYEITIVHNNYLCKKCYKIRNK